MGHDGRDRGEKMEDVTFRNQNGVTQCNVSPCTVLYCTVLRCTALPMSSMPVSQPISKPMSYFYS